MAVTVCVEPRPSSVKSVVLSVMLVATGAGGGLVVPPLSPQLLIRATSDAAPTTRLARRRRDSTIANSGTRGWGRPDQRTAQKRLRQENWATAPTRAVTHRTRCDFLPMHLDGSSVVCADPDTRA